MEDFDYANYGMGYDENNSTENKTSSKKDDSSTQMESEKEAVPLATVNTCDIHRISELDLNEYDFPDKSKKTLFRISPECGGCFRFQKSIHPPSRNYRKACRCIGNAVEKNGCGSPFL